MKINDQALGLWVWFFCLSFVIVWREPWPFTSCQASLSYTRTGWSRQNRDHTRQINSQPTSYQGCDLRPNNSNHSWCPLSSHCRLNCLNTCVLLTITLRSRKPVWFGGSRSLRTCRRIKTNPRSFGIWSQGGKVLDADNLIMIRSTSCITLGDNH